MPNFQQILLDDIEGKVKGDILWGLLSSLEKGDFKAFWDALPDQYKTALITGGAGEIAKVFPKAAPFLTLAETVA